MQKEGEVYSIGEHILVDGAKEVTLYIDIETSFREVNFRETCMKRLEKAQKRDGNNVWQSISVISAAFQGECSLCLEQSVNRRLPHIPQINV